MRRPYRLNAPTGRDCSRAGASTAGTIELGRDVSHLFEGRIEKLAGDELLRIRERLIGRPLAGGDHGLAAGFQDLAKKIAGQLGPERIVQLVPDEAGLLDIIDPEMILEGSERARLVVAEIHDRLRDRANELFDGLGVL